MDHFLTIPFTAALRAEAQGFKSPLYIVLPGAKATRNETTNAIEWSYSLSLSATSGSLWSLHELTSSDPQELLAQFTAALAQLAYSRLAWRRYCLRSARMDRRIALGYYSRRLANQFTAPQLAA